MSTDEALAQLKKLNALAVELNAAELVKSRLNDALEETADWPEGDEES